MTQSQSTSTQRRFLVRLASFGGSLLRRGMGAMLAPPRLACRYCLNKRALISVEPNKLRRYEAFCHLAMMRWDCRLPMSFQLYSTYENAHCLLNWRAPTYQERNRKLIRSLLNWQPSGE